MEDDRGMYNKSALKITFENLPIIKIKAVEKIVAHHGWAARKFWVVSTCLQKISVLSLDLKQAPSALRKNIGILGYRDSREFEERARGTCDIWHLGVAEL